jgi:hypothetical protein
MANSTRKATRKEVAEFLRTHYRGLVSETNSGIQVTMLDAIDAYEREPELKQQLAEAQRKVVEASKTQVAMGSYLPV